MHAALKSDYEARKLQLGRQFAMQTSQIVAVSRHIKALRTLTYQRDFLPVEINSLDSVSGSQRTI